MSEVTLCYVVFSHSTKNIVKVRDVTFIEDEDDHLKINEFHPVAHKNVTNGAWAKKASNMNYTAVKGLQRKQKSVKQDCLLVSTDDVASPTQVPLQVT